MNARLAAALVAAAATLPLGGCIIVSNGGSSSSDYNRVSAAEMDSIVDSNKFLEVGQSKAEALSLFPGNLITLKGSQAVDGYRVEEWRVYAQQKRPEVTFRRWIYFVDGRVAAFSDDRIPYQNSDRVAGWVESIENDDTN